MVHIEMRISDDSRPDGTVKGDTTTGLAGLAVSEHQAGEALIALAKSLFVQIGLINPPQPDPLTPAAEGGVI